MVKAKLSIWPKTVLFISNIHRGIQETTNIATNKKIKRAYTVKDIKRDDIHCAMVTKLNMEIN